MTATVAACGLAQTGLFDSGELDEPPSKWMAKRELEESGTPVSEVTVLSFGAGQDSTYLLHRLHYDKTFRQQYAPGRLLIVHADTGDEHPETYEHVERIRGICAERGEHFVHITAAMGYHSPAWQSLMGQYERNDNICGTGLTRSCTDNLKLTPIYRWLADQLASDYGLPAQRDDKGRFQTARTLDTFTQQHGRVRMLLGIAAKEERRMYGSMGWRGRVTMRQYPMVWDGIDRLAAIEAIESMGEVVPPPSHCMRCHYQGPQQLLLLSREYPDKWQQWVDREAAKILRWAHRGQQVPPVPNYGVYGLKLLPEMLAEAERQYGDWSNAKLREFAFTRGCATVSY